MGVTLEMYNTGDAESQRDVKAMIEHMLSDRGGDWHISIMGSQANDQWEMKILGPQGFERSYTLDGASGQHEPAVIGAIVSTMVPKRRSQ
jgi:hypothetical protein